MTLKSHKITPLEGVFIWTKNSFSLIQFLLKQDFSTRAGLVASLAFLVFASNIATHQAFASDFLDTGQEETISISSAIAPFTPILEESSHQLTLAMDGQTDGFLQSDSMAETFDAPSTYTVQNGDTLSTIARKHEVTVATILEANDMKTGDSALIKPGVDLTIPRFSTNDSLAWLDEENRIKAEKEEAARKQREKQENERKKRLALASNRTLPYRDSSTSRQQAAAGYSGAASGGNIVPIRHNGITRGLGRGHTGIDYRADVGTPVMASKNGRIIETTSGWAGGFGTSILVDHGSGVTTRYAHLSRIAASVGQTVGQGEIIGYSGNSGLSTGPHLHFEQKVNGSVSNPF